MLLFKLNGIMIGIMLEKDQIYELVTDLYCLFGWDARVRSLICEWHYGLQIQKV